MKKLLYLCLALFMMFGLAGCDEVDDSRFGSYDDIQDTKEVGNKLSYEQATPTDIGFSIERYNLIKRAYWVNAMPEKSKSVKCPVVLPIGWVQMMSRDGTVVGQYSCKGKVSSLNSYLTPDSEYYTSGGSTKWLPDVDGSYGTNIDGIFWFDQNDIYHEWHGDYHYSDHPVSLQDTVLGGDY